MEKHAMLQLWERENMEIAIGLLLLAIYLYVKLMIKFCAFMIRLTMLFLIVALKTTISHYSQLEFDSLNNC